MAKQVNLTLRANCGCAQEFVNVKGTPLEVLTAVKRHIEETGHVVEIRGEGRAT